MCRFQVRPLQLCMFVNLNYDNFHHFLWCPTLTLATVVQDHQETFHQIQFSVVDLVCLPTLMTFTAVSTHFLHYRAEWWKRWSTRDAAMCKSLWIWLNAVISVLFKSYPAEPPVHRPDCQTSIQQRNAEQTKTALFYFHKVAKGLASLLFFACCCAFQ